MIVKVKNKNNFAQIQNSTLRDKRLSLETRGALGEILTYSEDFETSVESLMSLWNIGRDKLLKITNQLKEFGYLEIKPVRDAKGKIVDKEWSFYGESQNTDFRNSSKTEVIQDTEKPNVGQNQTLENPNVGKNQSLENTDDLLKDEFKKKYEEKELETHTENVCAESADEYQAVWSYLADHRMDTPFDYPKWEKAIEYAKDRNVSAESFVGCIVFLRTDPDQKNFRKGRITAEVVTNNLSHYLQTLKTANPAENKPDWKREIEDCPMCDEKGLIETNGKKTPCNHGKNKKYDTATAIFR